MAASPSKDLEDYWNEFNRIEQGSDHSDEDDLSKTPDEGEAEAAWLDAAGYGHVVNTFQAGNDLSAGELDCLTLSLTRAQAQAVRKRIDTLSNTLRCKVANKPASSKIHVKDIFSTPAGIPDSENGAQDGTTDMSRLRSMSFQNNSNNRISPTNMASTSPNYSRRSDPIFLHKGGYHVSKDNKIFLDDLNVQTLGIHPVSSSSTKDGQDSDTFGLLPSVSDMEISLDFQLEETDKPLSPAAIIPDPHRVDLPAFEPKPDSLGVTSIGDLAPCDMDKIKLLAHIELTALFDHYGILYSRAKRKKKGKEQGIFGVPLDILVDQDRRRQSGNTKVPLVFQAMVTYLEKEGLHADGILRLSGAESTIKQLRADLEEKFYQGLFSWGACGPHCVAALLKQFLRELPIPLLSYQHLDAFPGVSGILKTLEQLKALNLLILLLPDEHRDTLKVLLNFLRRVISFSNENRMGLNNVAMIMAPNLFVPSPRKAKGGRGTPDLDVELKKAAETSSMVKMLIHYQDVLWTVPSAFIAQIRHQYITEAHRKHRDKMQLIRLPWKKDKDRSELYRKPNPTPEQPEPQEGVIRVLAPHLTKSSALVQLDQFTTAADVVSKFRFEEANLNREKNTIGKEENLDGHSFRNPNNALYAQDNDCLYEVGGNIAERCLDPRTKMLDLYHVNPTAEWVIRMHSER